MSEADPQVGLHRRRTLIPLATILLAALIPAQAAKDPDTPYTQITKLASYISEGDNVSALRSFDKNMKNYGVIAEDLGALAAQTETLCSIDIVEDKEADKPGAYIHHLDLDWYMMLKSLADPALVERRRERVAVTMQRFDVNSGKDRDAVWRIVSLSPDRILGPITVK